MKDIIDKINFLIGEENEEPRVAPLANKSSTAKKQKQRQYYARNKTKIQAQKDKFEESPEAKKRKDNKNRMKKVNKTPTGKKKVKYRKHQA